MASDGHGGSAEEVPVRAGIASKSVCRSIAKGGVPAQSGAADFSSQAIRMTQEAPPRQQAKEAPRFSSKPFLLHSQDESLDTQSCSRRRNGNE